MKIATEFLNETVWSHQFHLKINNILKIWFFNHLLFNLLKQTQAKYSAGLIKPRLGTGNVL